MAGGVENSNDDERGDDDKSKKHNEAGASGANEIEFHDGDNNEEVDWESENEFWDDGNETKDKSVRTRFDLS